MYLLPPLVSPAPHRPLLLLRFLKSIICLVLRIQVLTAFRLRSMSCIAKIENLWSLVTCNSSGTQMKLNHVNLHTQKLHVSFGKRMTTI